MKEPEFFEQAGAFVVRLWSRSYVRPVAMVPIDYVDLSERQKKILKLLENNSLSPNEILSGLKQNVTDRTLRRDLQFLKEKSYLNVEGNTRKSRWFLTKK